MGIRIIVVEDEPLIALDIEEAVLDADCEVVGCASTIEEAMALLSSVRCDGVVVDANLGGENASPILERLETDNIPYIVVSGYSRDQLDMLDDATVLISKPFRLGELTRSVRENFLKETSR